MTLYAVLPLPPLTTWPEPCVGCNGSGITGETWEMPTEPGKPVLLIHGLCLECGGCGNGNPDHAGCTADLHAYPEDHDQADVDEHDDETGPECPSCGSGRGWNAVQGFEGEGSGAALTLTRVPCGCSTERLITGTDPAELAELRASGEAEADR